MLLEADWAVSPYSGRLSATVDTNGSATPRDCCRWLPPTIVTYSAVEVPVPVILNVTPFAAVVVAERDAAVVGAPRPGFLVILVAALVVGVGGAVTVVGVGVEGCELPLPARGLVFDPPPPMPSRITTPPKKTRMGRPIQTDLGNRLYTSTRARPFGGVSRSPEGGCPRVGFPPGGDGGDPPPDSLMTRSPLSSPLVPLASNSCERSAVVSRKLGTIDSQACRDPLPRGR